MAPAHVIDVQKPIEAAQVDKCAKTRKALDNPFNRVADLRGMKESLAASLDFFLHELASVEDDVDLFIGI